MNDNKSTRRTAEEEAILQKAKQALLASDGMTEAQAHRFLQKRSMDSGARLADTARQVLDEISKTNTGKGA